MRWLLDSALLLRAIVGSARVAHHLHLVAQPAGDGKNRRMRW